ncbi:MAG: hypothetical protein M1814_002303 [Vezdaea aestivalis]|nr:MAG: hypothetical protein M1814_002303 [Vezdaea aestivalis]
MITEGINVNAKDGFDYTPLILASLCGHYEVVSLLLESGAICERDTFQGERCIHNAFNLQIRDLLIQYDYSKSTDRLQPLVAHMSSLLTMEQPNTKDCTFVYKGSEHVLHKFLLAARSPSFAEMLENALVPQVCIEIPDESFGDVPTESLAWVFRHLYLDDLSVDWARILSADRLVAKGADAICNGLEMSSMFGLFAESSDGEMIWCEPQKRDRNFLRERTREEAGRAAGELERWCEENVFKKVIELKPEEVEDFSMNYRNPTYADVLLRVDIYDKDEDDEDFEEGPDPEPIGSWLYPCHRAMLIRSEYFRTMFSSGFKEAQKADHLHIITVDCSPEVLEIVILYLYSEKTEVPLRWAVELLFTADSLFIPRLKAKAAAIIDTLGDSKSGKTYREPGVQVDEWKGINVYEVLRVGWFMKIDRLESFAARYFAYHLEDYVNEEDFADLVKESAARIKNREATDTIELIDDIRYYLDERFRMRFEESGLPVMEMATLQTGKEFIDNTLEVEGRDTTAEDPCNDQTETLRDAFGQQAIDFRDLLGALDSLLESLDLDA